MDNQRLIEILEKAIKNRLTVKIKIRHKLGEKIEIDFQPYIFGADMMQYDFVWGFID